MVELEIKVFFSADLEQQILEKEKGTRDLEIENANLESSIEHLNVLYVKQEEDNKRYILYNFFFKTCCFQAKYGGYGIP